MFKTLGIVQLAVAPVLVIPAVSGQDSSVGGLDAQLEATLETIEYLGSLRDSVRSGDRTALRALERATEAPRDSGPQRSAHMQALSDDIAQLRYSLDKLLENPSDASAITSMPASVVRALGLIGGAPEAAPTESTPRPTGTGSLPASATAPGAQPGGALTFPPGARTIPPSLAGTSAALPTAAAGTGPAASTAGMSEEARRSMEAIVGPLDAVSPASRRRGTGAVPLEKEGYVADRARLGRLLVRSGRTAEAIELLEGATSSVDARYWLARAYESAERYAEALEIYQSIAGDESAGIVSRHAKHDLEFLEVKRSLESGR